MNKKNFLKLSLYTGIISVIVFIINYFFYHFVTDDGISLTFNEEPGKPFVANLIGYFAVMFLFASVISLLIAHIFYPKDK